MGRGQEIQVFGRAKNITIYLKIQSAEGNVQNCFAFPLRISTLLPELGVGRGTGAGTPSGSGRVWEGEGGEERGSRKESQEDAAAPLH